MSVVVYDDFVIALMEYPPRKKFRLIGKVRI